MPATAQPSARAIEMAEKLAQWNRAYYDGTPEVDDDTWQGVRDMLAKQWPDCPLLRQIGAPVNPASALKKAKHGIPMGSLANAFVAEDIQAFLARVRKLSTSSFGSFPRIFVLQPKMDGLSLDLRYQGGVLVQAITRGDGVEGEDVTHNAMRMHGAPKALPTTDDLWVRGEVVIHKDDLREYFPDAANARNAAAGTCRRLDGAGAEHLRFYGFDAVKDDGTPIAETEPKMVRLLARWGFGTVDFEIVKAMNYDEDPALVEQKVLAAWTAFKDARAGRPYLCDGLVIKVANKEWSKLLGEVDSCPRAMLAMKWKGAMVAETTLRAVEDSVGRTGAITPVGILDPVDVGGVQVTRVSLCNYDEIVRLGVTLGSRVRVERAGEVIPKVTAVLASPDDAPVIQRPARCPKCSTETVEDGPRQLCPNSECPARTYRAVLHWVKQRNILDLGPETVDKLMALDGPVQNIDDLYGLTEKQWIAATGGVVMAEKVREAVERSRTCTLVELLGSVGIPGLGMTEAGKLVKALKLRDVDDFLLACHNTGRFDGIAGFGQTKTDKIAEGGRLRVDLLRRLAACLEVTEEKVATGPLSGKTFCATGASELPREKLIALGKAAGGEWKSSVVNGLNFLIVADPNSNSTKLQAAKKKGVQLISETDFLDMVGYTA